MTADLPLTGLLITIFTLVLFMKKGLKITIVVLLAGLVIIQFFPGRKPVVAANNPQDLHHEVLVNEQVSRILRDACYDCHSNETTFPWYTGVAPFSWLILHDIEEGRKELNFSEWSTFTAKRKHHKLDELIEEVEKGEMPLKIYSVMHNKADLSEEQINALIGWARTEMEKLTPEI